jgi:L-fucose mutarotase/ribose pyranase (RbsD/FucU family)
MPSEGTQALLEMQSVISKHCPEIQLQPVDRFEFYEQARRSFAVVALHVFLFCMCLFFIVCACLLAPFILTLSLPQIHTLERRPYANVLLTKGVVGADGRDLKP